MEEQIEQNFQTKEKGVGIFWLFGSLLLLGTALVFYGLWGAYKNDQSNLNVAINQSNEVGSVLGTSTSDPESLINLVNNLKSAGYVLYGFSDDTETKKQLLVFSQAVNGLDYVECDSRITGSNSVECMAKGIDKYPTWVVGEKHLLGYRTANQLEQLLVSQK